MISALIVSSLLGADPGVGEYIREARRGFIEDGVDRVSATTTHRVISRADGSLELQGAQPLKLSLQSITRATSCQTNLITRLTMLDAPSTVRSLRGCDVEESWTNSPIGLEHAFTILRAPPGSGGFSLFIRVEGPWHHADDDGHVFKGPGAASSLRYGRAFVVRGGQRLPIEVVHVEGGLELRVPASLADAPGAFPMEIDPVLTAEVPLDPVMGFDASPGRDETPAIAMNNQGTTMVVWADDRRQLGADLYGARITAAGGLGDPAGLPINLSPGHQVRPTICADGPNFLVAWELGHPDGGVDILARQVSAGGVLGPEFLAVDGGAFPALAAAGDSGINLLAYVDTSTTNARVIPIIGRTPGFVISRNLIADENAARPAIAASNQGWYVAYEAGRGSTVIRGMSSGMAGANIVPISDVMNTVSAARPTVALATMLTTEDAIVAWEQGANVIRGARLSTLTNPVPFGYAGRSPGLVRTSYALNALPTLGAFTPSTTAGSTTLQLRDFNDGGLSELDVGPLANDLVMTGANQRIVAAWTESPRAERDVYGAVLGPTSTGASRRFLVSRAANSQRNARVAMLDGKDEGLAVWIDGSTTLYGARIEESSNGLRIGSRFHVYSSMQTLARVGIAPVSDASGSDANYLITWRTAGGTIMGQLMTTSSVTVPPFVLGSSGATAGPAVAWDEGSQVFQVAWSLDTAAVTRSVSRTGMLGAQTSRQAVQASDLAIDCLRSNCLLAIERPTRELTAVMFGNVAGAPYVPTAPAGSPAIAHDGTHFYLAWHSAGGIALAKFDAANAGVTVIPGGIPSASNAAVTGLSMASATPPVLVWSELVNSEEASVYLRRVDLQDSAKLVAQGFNAGVAVTSPNTEPLGIVVYQRFISTAVNSMRVFATGFTFLPDAGSLDAGVDFDAGVPDAGVDAGLDGGSNPGVDGGSMGSDAGVEGGADAGVNGDGGPMMFGTSGCGCQSSAGAPLGVLFAIFLRRRRAARG